jgi:acetylornithine/N-succinyldiaminopimelate aminotransferase
LPTGKDAKMSRATTATSAQTIEQFNQFVIPNYKRFPICLVRGEGSYVWDAEGNRYLDLFPGWGCNILGYSPPAIVRAIQSQVAELIHVPNTWYTEAQGEFAELLCTRGFGQAFFCNSGAEAVEAAIKLARLHGEGRYKIITFENSFHGRTLGALTATAQPKYHEGLGPLVAGFRYAPLNDLDAVKDLIDDETCGFLLEPVQGEGGIHIAEDEFLVGLRQLADEHRCSLIFDEVQTGMGRTGSWFAYQQTPVQPDILTLAKGLAGGVACGAMIARPEIAKSLRPGTHASTFGGNPLAMAAGCAAVRMIEEEGLLDNCRRMSERFRTRFEALQSELPLIRELRIRGMMIGIELNVPAGAAVQKAMQRGVLLNVTHDTVVRLLPAMNITEEQVDQGCEAIAEVLREIADES